MEQQFDAKQVEPNSRSGQAFNEVLKRWAALTGFLRIPGAPLDNKPVEQVPKQSVRYRNNSFFTRICMVPTSATCSAVSSRPAGLPGSI